MIVVTDAFCSECLRRGIPLVSLGGMDSRGYVDQESGADLCADCLRKALAMLEPTATGSPPSLVQSPGTATGTQTTPPGSG